MRTYGKKKRPLITPVKNFPDFEVGGFDPGPPLVAHSSLTAGVLRKPDSIEEMADELLASSPARSDQSSSIKSVEPALERRISLLLRQAGSPSSSKAAPELISCAGSPHAIQTGQSCIKEASSPRELSAVPSMRHEDRAGVRHHKRLSSFASSSFFFPSKTGRPRTAGSSPVESIKNKLGKKTSVATAHAPFPGAHPTTPAKGSPVGSSKSRSSLKSSLDAGLRALSRAKSAVSRKTSPLISAVSRKGNRRPKPILSQVTLQRDLVTNGEPWDSLSDLTQERNGHLDHPVTIQRSPRLPPVSLRPCTKRRVLNEPNNLTEYKLEPTISSSIGISDYPNLPVSESAMTGPCQRLRTTPQTQTNGKHRPSAVEISKTRPFSTLRREGAEVVELDPFDIPAHKLSRAATRTRRPSLAQGATFDLEDRADKKLRPFSEPLFPEGVQNEIATGAYEKRPSTPIQNARPPLGAKDANKKMSHGDEDVIKTAKALRFSVSPKAKLINKMPRRRLSVRPPSAVEVVLSRSSSKASRVLGHHVGSKEPLQPGRTGLEDNREGESTSEDELAL